jgi:hypothetical protein
MCVQARHALCRRSLVPTARAPAARGSACAAASLATPGPAAHGHGADARLSGTHACLGACLRGGWLTEVCAAAATRRSWGAQVLYAGPGLSALSSDTPPFSYTHTRTAARSSASASPPKRCSWRIGPSLPAELGAPSHRRSRAEPWKPTWTQSPSRLPLMTPISFAWRDPRTRARALGARVACGGAAHGGLLAAATSQCPCRLRPRRSRLGTGQVCAQRRPIPALNAFDAGPSSSSAPRRASGAPAVIVRQASRPNKMSTTPEGRNLFPDTPELQATRQKLLDEVGSKHTRLPDHAPSMLLMRSCAPQLKQTEASYVQSLGHIVDSYLGPIWDKHLYPKNGKQTLDASLHAARAIHTLHARFLEDLQKSQNVRVRAPAASRTRGGRLFRVRLCAWGACRLCRPCWSTRSISSVTTRTCRTIRCCRGTTERLARRTARDWQLRVFIASRWGGRRGQPSALPAEDRAGEGSSGARWRVDRKRWSV